RVLYENVALGRRTARVHLEGARSAGRDNVEAISLSSRDRDAEVDWDGRRRDWTRACACRSEVRRAAEQCPGGRGRLRTEVRSGSIVDTYVSRAARPLSGSLRHRVELRDRHVGDRLDVEVETLARAFV